MLARRITTILPYMNEEEALEVTKIYSIVGLTNNNQIITQRPFRSPHHTTSKVALIGGGRNANPGEISLAHRGILFLDELPEFNKSSLEVLRIPLEDRTVLISRANQNCRYPANFMLIASMNPCPCGYYGSTTNQCKCSPASIHKYLSKISGPLMDRIDLHIEVDAINYEELTQYELEEPSERIKERVNKARAIQLDRFKESKVYSNAKMSEKDFKEYCKLDKACTDLLETAFKKFNLSARAYNRILKVARTIADLDGKESIERAHLMEAIQYRTLDKKYTV